MFVVTWPPSLYPALRLARDFVRAGLDAHRRGQPFSDTRVFNGVTVSITGAWVRVKLNDESYGLGVEEAAALAGVGAPALPVPKIPALPYMPGVPLTGRRIWERRDVAAWRSNVGAGAWGSAVLPAEVRAAAEERRGLSAFLEREREVRERAGR